MNGHLSQGRRHKFPGDEITWAGECPWTDNYCFGTENGEVLFHEDAAPGQFSYLRNKLAEEAINGVAFYKEFVGVSTRSELLLYRKSPGGGFERRVQGPGGAFGVLATQSGQFLAPMGTDGIFCIDKLGSDRPRGWFDNAANTQLNFYSLAYLGKCADQEILACAARNDGLLTIRFDMDDVQNQIIGLTAPNIDFIDACPLNSRQWPYAVAALCHDRSLIFVRNVLTEDNPRTLRFDEFRGTPYSILSAQGHIFVLTSSDIIVIPDLASRYLNDEQLDRPIHFRHKAVRAVDAFVLRGHDLVILTDDEVNIFEITALVPVSRDSSGAQKSHDSQNWDEIEGIPAIVSTTWGSLVA
jgi:hypothetical protein